MRHNNIDFMKLDKNTLNGFINEYFIYDDNIMIPLNPYKPNETYY